MLKREIFSKIHSLKLKLKKILKLSGLKPQELLRKRDKKFKELKLDEKSLPDSRLIKLMAKNPGLIRRPIIISKNKAHVGKVNPREI